MSEKRGWYRDKAGRVVIQIYDAETGTPKKVSRRLYKHLDKASDEDVTAWRSAYVEEHRDKTSVARTKVLTATDEAQYLFDQFLAEYQSLRNTRKSTAGDERGRWHNYITQYFVAQNGEKNVRVWSQHTAGFPLWLSTDSELEINQQKKVIGLLERFSVYLARNRLIPQPWVFLKPTENTSAETPLRFNVYPDDILKWSAAQPPRLALLSLLGYFVSLRPEETFALRKEDFLLGQEARDRAKTYKRFQLYNLGSGLSLDIQRAFNKDGEIGPPKTRAARAVANVFSRDAAQRIVELVRDLPDGWLFPRRKRIKKDVYEYDWQAPKPTGRKTMSDFWTENGFKKIPVEGGEPEIVYLHDLRRASAMYLGRELDLPSTLVQEHLRHADMKTTMLYMRRPGDRKAKPPRQNWDEAV